MTKQIEAEGGELVLRNKNGSVAIIPARHRQEVLDMLKGGCSKCLDDYISKLPKMADVAKDGTVIPDKEPKELSEITIRGKKYPKGTIVTNNPNDSRIKAYKDSLDTYNFATDWMDKADNLIGKTIPFNREDENNIWSNTVYGRVDDKGALHDNLKPIGKSRFTLNDTNPPYEKNGIVVKGAKSTGDSITIADIPIYKKPTQPVIYQAFVNRMLPKGLPTSTKPTLKTLTVPDRIEKDSKTGKEYKGIDVTHYTDALGRYTAKLNLSTTPGIRGRISTNN